VDGSVNYNNPVFIADSERTFLWPHHSDSDITLSIGTGFKRESGDIREDKEAVQQGYISTLAEFVAHVAKQSLNSERIWEEFLASRRSDEATLTQRYFRLNVEFPRKKLPKLDSVKDMRSMADAAALYCLENSDWITSISNKLISSLFYLVIDEVRADPVTSNKEKQQCKGFHSASFNMVYIC